ncbi:DUF6480 family protein [Streptomyces palmae]|uniref:Uncharacterized protein n=1 Tax=Streptomyces palmae TaxID=1701085 RepID=A0A4Z0HCV6_9ACTN|nr:DUF6480 family protein [Streptomyces palmae]TGB12030.1 hypothetical protein E4099_11525 [Streptomyces palmae]
MTDKTPETGPLGPSRPEPASKVPPGETPPGESSMSGAGPQETYNPTKGWAKGPTTIILVLVVLFAAFCVAFAVVVSR